ncbi:aminotransferase class I/II-fold pyridoxal phosphate-dependent enzyme [Cohnella endophytica]|uniref:homocysteine desulfhydrase n=1 Tax=Cohnella endophytica TaxID=2419778 RepID=A0A494XP01_9BACL|nr:aminotransferase class I/II-fold pyridoxal phosphate-dependent enzyme [Cohnella endophytica]RKP49849.1 aminotransferase class I/II-fold pyridoxal phosphate-dependent enzyme [Cohnella endophytica]
MTLNRLTGAQTIVAHDPHDEQHHGAVTKPIYQNSLFTFDSYDRFLEALQDEIGTSVYSRGTNPTVTELEHRLAKLEGGEQARCFASGMASISAAILSVVRAGDHIVCINEAYGPAVQFMGNYLTKFDIETTFVDGKDLGAVEAAMRENTRLIYLESPTSLFFSILDIPAIVGIAKRANARTIIDNTWATPCYQRPLEMGVDLVVHSLTKYVSGHSDAIGGTVIGRSELMKPLIKGEFMLLGGIMTPANANLIMRGLRTLPLRMEKYHRQGLEVAAWLEKHPLVAKMNHPGLPSHPQHELATKQMSGSGSLFSFETDIPLETMRRWAERLRYFRIGVSWGGYESLVTVHPVPTNRPGSARTLVRLYIGLESTDELIQDLVQAFEGIEA